MKKKISLHMHYKETFQTWGEKEMDRVDGRRISQIHGESLPEKSSEELTFFMDCSGME